VTLHDFLPDEKLRDVDNLHDFAGMLVFDKWTCNTNGRQTVFFPARKPPGSPPPVLATEDGGNGASKRYHTVMID